MAPQRSIPEPRYDNTPTHSGFEAQPARQQPDKGQDEGSSTEILAPLARPLIATVAGIILFCTTNFFHLSLLGHPILFTLVFPSSLELPSALSLAALVGLGGVVLS